MATKEQAVSPEAPVQNATIAPAKLPALSPSGVHEVSARGETAPVQRQPQAGGRLSRASSRSAGGKLSRMSAVPLLQRTQCACGREADETGKCAECKAQVDNQQHALQRRIQRKMTVNTPGDEQEQEADQVASSVVQRLARSLISRQGAPAIQRQSARNGVPDVDSETEAKIEGARGGGQPLSSDVHRSMESAFDADFKGVRVHTDANADHLNRALDARAFTTGQDVFFKQGEYNPSSSGGQELLAHELTHVVQQGEGQGVYRQIQRDGNTPIPSAPVSSPSPAPPQGAAENAPKPINDAGPLRPNSDFYFFRQVMMTTDSAFMEGELRRLIRREGIRGGNMWYQSLCGGGFDLPLPFSAHTRGHGGLRVRDASDAQRDMVDEEKKKKLAPVAVPLAQRIYPVIHREALKFLADFEISMNKTLGDVLTESEKRIEAERIRYGISKTGDGPGAKYEAKDTVAFQGLVGAAKDLLQIRTRVGNLQIQQGGLKMSRGKGGTVLPESNKAKYEELAHQIQTIEEEYTHARTSAALRYPALGAILDDSGVMNHEAVLRNIANGDLKSGPQGRFSGPRGAADKIGQVFDSRQESIDKVRVTVRDDPEKLWNIASIVKLTRVAMNTQSGTMADRLVDDKLAELKADEELKGILVAVISLALAIPTGGGSLAVAAGTTAAGISAYQAMKSIQNYELEMALTNTDLDKRAAALATDEPSVFWVALDVVFAIVDGVAALKAFRAIKVDAKAALLAGEGAEAAEAQARLMKAADAAEGVKAAEGAEEVGKSNLAKRLRESLARMRGKPVASRTLGVVGSAEGGAVAHASELIAKEAHAAETITTIGGHQIKVTKGGNLVICSDCTWLRERFTTELAGKSDLLKRLETLESKVKQAGTKVDEATKTEIATLAQDLRGAQKSRLIEELGQTAGEAVAKLHEEADMIAAHGKKLKLSDDEIGTFMKLRANTSGMTVEQVTKSMDEWKTAGGLQFGKNQPTKLRKHSQHIRETARRLGVEIPKSPVLPETQAAMENFMRRVTVEGKTARGRYLSIADAIWSRLGDAIVVRQMDGTFVTFLDATKDGAALARPVGL